MAKLGNTFKASNGADIKSNCKNMQAGFDAGFWLYGRADLIADIAVACGKTEMSTLDAKAWLEKTISEKLGGVRVDFGREMSLLTRNKSLHNDAIEKYQKMANKEPKADQTPAMPELPELTVPQNPEVVAYIKMCSDKIGTLTKAHWKSMYTKLSQKYDDDTLRAFVNLEEFCENATPQLPELPQLPKSDAVAKL